MASKGTGTPAATGGSAINRRDMLRRGALVGGALVWTVPVVQSLSLTPAHAESPSAPGNPGNPGNPNVPAGPGNPPQAGAPQAGSPQGSAAQATAGGLAETGAGVPVLGAVAIGAAAVAAGAAAIAITRRPAEDDTD